jgi:quercetin dioxygenase-like cupin family protein
LRGQNVIVRNINDPEVIAETFIAHGGGSAQMLLDSRVLRGILFLAHGLIKPGKTIESHRDPYEEIYFILSGEGLMSVDGEERQVKPGDAIWIPQGAAHSLFNNTENDCHILVIAAYA